MGRSRRSVAAAIALALAGCAGGGRETATTDASPDPVRDQPASKWKSADPLEWWATVPDLALVNEGSDGVTAYVAIYGRDWVEPQFREAVSLRAPVYDEPSARVAFEDVDVVGASAVLAVETADGRTGAHDWTAGGDRRGIVVHLYDDHVAFAVVRR